MRRLEVEVDHFLLIIGGSGLRARAQGYYSCLVLVFFPEGVVESHKYRQRLELWRLLADEQQVAADDGS